MDETETETVTETGIPGQKSRARSPLDSVIYCPLPKCFPHKFSGISSLSEMTTNWPISPPPDPVAANIVCYFPVSFVLLMRLAAAD